METVIASAKATDAPTPEMLTMAPESWTVDTEAMFGRRGIEPEPTATAGNVRLAQKQMDFS